MRKDISPTKIISNVYSLPLNYLTLTDTRSPDAAHQIKTQNDFLSSSTLNVFTLTPFVSTQTRPFGMH